MPSGLRFRPPALLAPWLRSPVSFPQEAEVAGAEAAGRWGGGESCEVCGLGCEAHIRASADTRASGSREPLLSTSPSSCFSFQFSPEIILCPPSPPPPPSVPLQGPEHRPQRAFKIARRYLKSPHQHQGSREQSSMRGGEGRNFQKPYASLRSTR